MEMFKKIKEYPMYSVSTLGRVRKDSTGKMMCASKKSNGYMQINLFTNDGRRKKEYVHRLIALTFIPNEHNLPEVNHLDGVRDHNTVDNLEWVSHRENMEKSTLLKQIRVYRKTGEFVGDFPSIQSACRVLNLQGSNVSVCVHSNVQKSHKGYVFELI